MLALLGIETQVSYGSTPPLLLRAPATFALVQELGGSLCKCSSTAVCVLWWSHHRHPQCLRLPSRCASTLVVWCDDHHYYHLSPYPGHRVSSCTAAAHAVSHMHAIWSLSTMSLCRNALTENAKKPLRLREAPPPFRPSVSTSSSSERSW